MAYPLIKCKIKMVKIPKISASPKLKETLKMFIFPHITQLFMNFLKDKMLKEFFKVAITSHPSLVLINSKNKLLNNSLHS